MNAKSPLKIMGKLIGLIKPLLPVMILAIILGTVGYLCAIFLTILATRILLQSIQINPQFLIDISIYSLMVLMVVLAILRGVFHYIEQYCNHYVAFKLLAIIRHKIFVCLANLAPAKLEGKDKGNLISIITNDIELLEVFYAHTISPIVIAFLTSIIMIVYIGYYSLIGALIAGLTYLLIGVGIPLINSKRGNQLGLNFRNKFGNLNTYILSSLHGLDAIIQYKQGKNRNDNIGILSDELNEDLNVLNKNEAKQRSATNISIMLGALLMFSVGTYLYLNNGLRFEALIISTVSIMGSCGPVVALSSLSNNLNQTIASGQRVLDLLDEKPLVENVDGDGTIGSKLDLQDVTFKYQDEEILKDYNLSLKENKITGLHGASGTGKSTILKLLMRFWDVNKGQVMVDNQDIKNIPTRALRNNQAYVTQETYIFNDTIANNISLGLDISKEEIIQSAKEASLHDFVMTLPEDYDTNLGELGSRLSGGEKQRIGLARAFAFKSKILLLDEPTSNLDALNEGIVLKSILDKKEDKTIILVSHRLSTLGICDEIIEMPKRIS